MAGLQINTLTAKTTYENQTLNWRNPYVTTESVTETNYLAPENDYWKIGGQGVFRLPARSTLSLRASYARLTDDLNLGTTATDSAAGDATGTAAGTGRVRAAFGGRSGDLDITVTYPPVASVAFDRDSLVLALVTPGKVTVAPIAKDSLGRPIAGAIFFFASDAPKVATVDQNGVITAVAAGAAVISANTQGITALLRVRVTANVTATSPDGRG